MSEEDLLPAVEIIHHISLRETLHTIRLTAPEKNQEVAMTLFGINPLLDKEQSAGILEQLNRIGTVFIQNVDYLALETQEALAKYIRYGYFYKFQSEHKIFSNVRIICSSHQDLLACAQEGKFSKLLYNELEKAAMIMPSLNSLTEAEIKELASGFASQLQTPEEYKNLLGFTEKEKLRLVNNRPLSLTEFKEKVRQLIKQKAHHLSLNAGAALNTSYSDAEPEIADAVRLGKKALKDQKIMTMLWTKFKSQSKIANLLGANRSTINRRCQEYNLK